MRTYIDDDSVVRAETSAPLRLRMASSSQSIARRPVAISERVWLVDIVMVVVLCNVREDLAPISRLPESNSKSNLIKENKMLYYFEC